MASCGFTYVDDYLTWLIFVFYVQFCYLCAPSFNLPKKSRLKQLFVSLIQLGVHNCFSWRLSRLSMAAIKVPTDTMREGKESDEKLGTRPTFPRHARDGAQYRYCVIDIKSSPFIYLNIWIKCNCQLRFQIKIYK